MDERKRMTDAQPRQCIAAPPGSDNLTPGATAGDGPCQAARGSQCLRSSLDGSGKRLPGTAIAITRVTAFLDTWRLVQLME